MNKSKIQSYVGRLIKRNVSLRAKKSRLVAKAIDIGICVTSCFFIKYIGIIIGALYILYADSLFEGQSVGKRIIGLKVLNLEDLTPCSVQHSIIRNLPLGLSIFLLHFGRNGLISSFSLMFLFGAYESYLILKENSIYRLGDIIAETTVIANDPNSESEQERLKALTQFMPSEFSGVVH